MSDRAICDQSQQTLALLGEKALAAEQLAHIERCSDCRSFAETVAPLIGMAENHPGLAPAGIVARTLTRMRPALLARSRTARRLGLRLALAGITTLPVILFINVATVWVLSSVLGDWIAEPVGWVIAYLGLASTLLGLSLLYGSLPLLAAWGAQLRQEA